MIRRTADDVNCNQGMTSDQPQAKVKHVRVRPCNCVPSEVTKAREQHDLWRDILETISDINPLPRSIIRDQGQWNMDQLAERLNEVLRDEEEE